jgi:hypothetical protein
MTRTQTQTQTPSVTPSRTNTPSSTPTATSGGGSTTFYRAVNLGGAALVIDGNNWEANTGTTPNFTTNGTAMCNPWASITPATDANRASMIQCSRQHWAHNVVMSAVPNGTYQVYLYTWLDWADPNPPSYSFYLNGTLAQTYQSGPSGRWDKLGPFTVNVTAGTLTVTTSGGVANFSGIEVYSVGGGAPAASATMTPSATRTMTPTSTLTRTATRTITPTAVPSESGGGCGDGCLMAPPSVVPTIIIDGVTRTEGNNPNITVANGTTLCNQLVTLNPPTDVEHTGMIRCSVTGTDLTIALNNMPANGAYNVYIWVWEDDAPSTYSIALQGGQVLIPNINSGAAGSWQRLGAFLVNVTDGTFTLTTTGGQANISAIEFQTVS